MTSTFPYFSSTVYVWAAGIAIAYTVGRVGIPTLYQDIKHFIQGVKGAVSGAETAIKTTTTTTPTTTA